MKIISQNINFKGYDACPIKNIYHSAGYCAGFLDEMIEAGESEGIDIRLLYSDNKWVQDDRVIVETGNKSYLLGRSDELDRIIYSGEIKFDPRRKRKTLLEGGNMFIGKYPDGQKWLLAGEDGKNIDIEKISSEYGVKPENIHFIPQQNYHLDMFLRPVGYPYILVNDPRLVYKNIEKLKGSKEEKEKFKNEFLRYYVKQKSYKYASCDKTVETLEKLGFKPIRIAGDYGPYANFMNSIVNRHEDGTLSYFTNSTKCSNRLYSSIEKVFEEDLREKVPNTKSVYFISGKSEGEECGRNFIMGTLAYGGGGIHCMSLEEPRFSAWG